MTEKPNARRALLGMLIPAVRRLQTLKKGWDVSMTVYEASQTPDGRKNYRPRRRREDEKPENNAAVLRFTYAELSTVIEELTLARSFVSRQHRWITGRGIV